MTPELKFPAVAMPFHGFSQEDYAQELIDEYKAAGLRASHVWPQSFHQPDVLYWVQHEPDFGRQAVYLDDANTPADLPTAAELQTCRAQGIRRRRAAAVRAARRAGPRGGRAGRVLRLACDDHLLRQLRRAALSARPGRWVSGATRRPRQCERRVPGSPSTYGALRGATVPARSCARGVRTGRCRHASASIGGPATGAVRGAVVDDHSTFVEM